MIDENKSLFDAFHSVHERYVANPITVQEEFNTVGKELQNVIHDYERRLCGKTESGQFGKFSHNLSEKFRELLRKDFPKIDYIGVTVG